jgi:hypothetical protein
MRLSAGLMLALLLGVPLVAGCGPAVPPDDLGTVLDEVPEIPGAEDQAKTPEPAPAAKPHAETPEPSGSSQLN